MNKIAEFIILLIISLISQGYANTLNEIFEIKEISSLYNICEKINKRIIGDDISVLGRFLYHNDRDFDDCCQVLMLCKRLSDKPELKNTEESLCVKSVKCILAHLLKIKSCIYSLYKDDLSASDCEFFEKVDVSYLIKTINKLEQNRKAKMEGIISPCTILLICPLVFMFI